MSDPDSVVTEFKRVIDFLKESDDIVGVVEEYRPKIGEPTSSATVNCIHTSFRKVGSRGVGYYDTSSIDSTDEETRLQESLSDIPGLAVFDIEIVPTDSDRELWRSVCLRFSLDDSVGEEDIDHE